MGVYLWFVFVVTLMLFLFSVVGLMLSSLFLCPGLWGNVFSLFVKGRRCLVWIPGHSFVYWGARRAEVRPAARQLGLPWEAGSVRWIGVRGMMWNRVVPKVHRFAWWDRARILW